MGGRINAESTVIKLGIVNITLSIMCLVKHLYICLAYVQWSSGT